MASECGTPENKILKRFEPVRSLLGRVSFGRLHVSRRGRRRPIGMPFAGAANETSSVVASNRHRSAVLLLRRFKIDGFGSRRRNLFLRIIFVDLVAAARRSGFARSLFPVELQFRDLHVAEEVAQTVAAFRRRGFNDV